MNIIDVRVSPDFCQIYCPVCGSQICGPEDVAKSPCKHALFVYTDCSGNFVYVSPALKKVAAKARKAAAKSVNPLQYMLKHLDASKPASILCFSITCDPASSTICVAIEFPSEGENSEE